MANVGTIASATLFRALGLPRAWNRSPHTATALLPHNLGEAIGHKPATSSCVRMATGKPTTVGPFAGTPSNSELALAHPLGPDLTFFRASRSMPSRDRRALTATPLRLRGLHRRGTRAARCRARISPGASSDPPPPRRALGRYDSSFAPRWPNSRATRAGSLIAATIHRLTNVSLAAATRIRIVYDPD